MGKLIIPNIGNNINLDNITATSNDILSGKIGIDNKGNIINGNIPIQGGGTIIPKTTNQTIVSSGKYINGNIIVQGDSDLIAANIKKGVNIFGVTGTAKVIKSKKFEIYSGSRATFNYYDVSGKYTSKSMYTVTITNVGFTPSVLILYPINQYQEYNCTVWTDFKNDNQSVVVIGSLTDWTQFWSPTTITANKIYVPVVSNGQYECWIEGY